MAQAEKRVDRTPPLIPLKPIDPTYVESTNASRVNKYYNQNTEVSLEHGSEAQIHTFCEEKAIIGQTLSIKGYLL